MKGILSAAAAMFLTTACACGGDLEEGAADTSTSDLTGSVDVAGEVALVELSVERPECENLNPAHCLMPWPSNRFLEADADTPSGFRVALTQAVMPVNKEGSRLEPGDFNRFDGFSPATTLVTSLSGGVDPSDLPDSQNIADSLLADSPTVLLDTVTGQRVAHFSELDEWPGGKPGVDTFYVHPATRLLPGRRYIVAIRGLQTTSGEAIEPSDYFRALRDATPTSLASLEARRAVFEDIFARLQAAGVARSGLIEAWDFQTASDELLYGDLLHMRDAAMEAVGDKGLGCTISAVEEDFGADDIWRRVTGTVTVPLYLEHDRPEVGVRLVRDAAGRPIASGTTEAPFTLIIPYSVRDRLARGEGPAPLLLYGHGFVSSAAGELKSAAPRSFAADNEAVVASTDWWGLTEAESPGLAAAISDLRLFPSVLERASQAIINALVLTRSLSGSCRAMPELSYEGAPAVAPDERYYFGISNGSVMGTAVAALSLDIERFALQAGGIAFPLIAKRSTRFRLFGLFMAGAYPDKLEQDLLTAMVQVYWDVVDSATFAPYLVANPLPGSHPKRILYQVGLHDAQVPNISSDMAARTIGLAALSSSAYLPWSVPVESGPQDSAYVIYDMGAEPIPTGAVAADEDNEVHFGLRHVGAVRAQVGAFLRADGRVESFCDGVCDPE